MFWHEVEPGRYERPCDAVETTFKTIADSTASTEKARWTVSIIAQLNHSLGSGVERALSVAWLHTRHQAPFIACTIDTNTRLSYKVPDEAEQNDWLVTSLFVEDVSLESFLLSAKRRKYSSLHYFPGTNELVLRLHHWLVDGIGALNVLTIFLTSLTKHHTSGPSFGDEWQRLSPSHAQAAGFATEASAELESHAQGLFLELVGNLPSVGLSVDTPNAVPGGVKRSRSGLDSDKTKAVIDSCKRLGFSVTSAVHAAIVVCTQDNASPSTKGLKFTALAPSNNRPRLPAPYNDTQSWPTGAYVMSPPFTLSEGDFLAHATRLHEVYHQPLGKGNPMYDAYEILCWKLCNTLTLPPPPGLSPSTTPHLSSLGLLDGKIVQAEYVGEIKIRLEDVEVVIDQMTPELFLYTWTYGKRLFISANFNESYYHEEYVTQFLSDVQKALLNGLGIESAKRGF